MKQQLERTRLYISTWYTGAGSLKSVFARRPNRPFSKMKQIYGEELERLNTNQHKGDVEIHQLSDAAKDRIRTKAKIELKKWYLTRIILLLVAFLFSGLLVSLLYFFILIKLI